jgi:hypothetical protein
MDLENLMPIILAIIYIASRFLKSKDKKKKAPKPFVEGQTSPTDQQGGAAGNKRGFSFEDILKEFEKNLSGEEGEDEPAVPEPAKPVRQQPFQPRKVSQPSPYKTYEGTVYESRATADLDTEKEGFERNQNYKMEEVEESDFLRLLKAPNGARNAIVLSEIINRKYF